MADSDKIGRRQSLIDPPAPREAKRAVSNLAETVEPLINYKPTVPQRKAKARLLIALEDNPTASLDTLTAEQASRLSRYDCTKFWSTPGFKEWLTGRNEFKERVEYLAHLSLDAAEEILLSDDPRLAGAKVNTLAQISKLADKFPSTVNSQKFADAFIQEMNRKELEQFIKQNVGKLPAAEFEDVDDQD